MKLPQALSFLSVLTLTSAIIPGYQELYDLCTSGGPNVVSTHYNAFKKDRDYSPVVRCQYVGVRYAGKVYKTFSYNECYPYEVDGHLAEMAVFCKSATCYDNP